MATTRLTKRGGGKTATARPNHPARASLKDGYQATEWIDPDDSDPNRRTARRVRGVRRVDPLDVLAAANPARWTPERVAAGRRYYALWAACQCSGRPLVPMRVTGSAATADGAAVAGVDAVTRFREASEAVSVRAYGAIALVVIEGASLRDVATALGVSQATASADLLTGLDCLAAHFSR